MKRASILFALILGLAGCQSPTPPASQPAPVRVAAATRVIQDVAPSPTMSAAVFPENAVALPDSEPGKVLNGFNLSWGANLAVLIQVATNLVAPPGAVSLVWLPNPDPATAGYNIYFGGASLTYTNKLSAGNATAYVVRNLVPGVTYYFAATASDSAGLETGFSNEAVFTVPSQWSDLTNFIGSEGFIPSNQFAGMPQVFFRVVALQPVTLQIEPVYAP